MPNTSPKRSWLSDLFMPGLSSPNMLEKLNIPGIEITSFRSFQHRTKAWRVEAYNPAKPNHAAFIKQSNKYRLNINGFKAWKIGFKNRLQTPIDITLHFRVQGKYVPGHDYKQTYKNLSPSQKAEMEVVPGVKFGTVRLDKVEVYAGTNLVSSIEVKTFMPFWKGNFGFSALLSGILGINFLIFSFNNSTVPGDYQATTLIYILAFCFVFLEAYNITAVISMFFLLLFAPLYLYNPVQRVDLFVLGGLYLIAVWRKRSSIKDFFIGAFLP